jgi:hypothetical protein
MEMEMDITIDLVLLLTPICYGLCMHIFSGTIWRLNYLYGVGIDKSIECRLCKICVLKNHDDRYTFTQSL